jgi:hypothetical protein
MSTYERRMETALAAAQEAFWTELASHFGECETGDLGAEDDLRFHTAAAEVARTWYATNLEAAATRYGLDYDPSNYDADALSDAVKLAQRGIR